MAATLKDFLSTARQQVAARMDPPQRRAFSQRQLSEALAGLGVEASQSTVSLWECDALPVPWHLRKPLARALLLTEDEAVELERLILDRLDRVGDAHALAS